VSAPGAPDVALEAALEAWQDDAAVAEGAARPSGAAALSAHLLALSFVALAVGLAARTPVPGAGRLAELVALVALYVVAYRVEFTASGGSMVPTQPVLVALLLAGSPALVPLGVLAAVLVASFDAPASGARGYDWAVRVLPAWHSVGPVAVLLAAGSTSPGPGDWRWLVLGTLAQFALDAVVAVVRMASIGVSPLVLVRPLWWTFRLDALMGVIGVLVVFGSRGAPPGVVVALVAAPVVLVRMLGRDRVEQVEQSRSLGAAFESASLEAVSDPMTGLGNRRRWERALADAERRAQDDPALRVGVLMADLDGLKHTNDSYGHDAGDALIRAFAEVLVEAVPADAVVARLGGDEFGVLVLLDDDAHGEDGDGTGTGDALLRALRAGIASRAASGGAALSASLGWACSPPLGSITAAAAAADEQAALDKRRRRAGRRADPPPALPAAAG
jgi:diguanylate cyclase (GGDEF)-like protein